MQRRDINAADAPAPAGQYTQAVEVTAATRTLYISGQVGVAADGSIPADAEAQSALAWRNLQAQLRAAGMGLENLVKITTIVPNRADLARGAGRPRVGARSASAGEHAHRRRPQQSSLEGRGGGHRGGLTARHGLPSSPARARAGHSRPQAGHAPITRRRAAAHPGVQREPKRPCGVRAP